MIYNNNWIKLAKFIIPFLIIVGCFQYLGMLIADVDFHAPSQNQNLQQILITSFFGLIGTFTSVLIFRKYVDKKTFSSLGLNYGDPKDITLGLIIGFVMMFVGFIMLVLLKEIDFIYKGLDLKAFLVSVLIFIIIALTEELLVRGYVLNTLMSSMNKYLALIISAIIFSLLHSFNPNISLYSLLNLFFAGILLGLSYLFTKNLVFPIALHFSWNFCQGTIFGFNVSGMNFWSLFVIKLKTNNYLNGGKFGFENSILCTVFQLIAILIVYNLFKKSRVNIPTYLDQDV